MGPLDALWHLANFFGPALGVGLIATGLCKLAWWRGLRAVPFPRLALWAVGAGALAALASLVVFGHDGRMAGYAFVVLAVALALWWRGLRHLP